MNAKCPNLPPAKRHIHTRKLGKNIGTSSVRASGTGPCWGGHGRGLNWVRSHSIEWGMKIVGYENAEFSDICE